MDGTVQPPPWTCHHLMTRIPWSLCAFAQHQAWVVQPGRWGSWVALLVPSSLVADCWPSSTAAPPAPRDVILQLVVDGEAWGPPFDSAIYHDKANRRWMVAKGLSRFLELAGCTVAAFRRRAEAAAFDVVIRSLADEERPKCATEWFVVSSHWKCHRTA